VRPKSKPVASRPRKTRGKGSAIVAYHELVQRLSIDGSIEDWAWEQLDRAREELGISDEAHEQIVAELITEDLFQVVLRVDMNSSQGFILGERCTMALRLDNLEDLVLDTARVWYTSSATQGRQKIDLEQLGPGESRGMILPFWPDSSGMHELDGILELTPLRGKARFVAFGPLGFRVGRRPPADLNLEFDPSPVHIQRQPLTRGDPLPQPGLHGTPQWRATEMRRIRRGAAEIWMRRHPIRHPSSTALLPRATERTRLHIAAVQVEPPPEQRLENAWQGPPLRTIFRELLDSDGEIDRYHSYIEVRAGDENVATATAAAVFGTQLASSWEWMRSPAYGAELCRQIRQHGLGHVQRLLCAPFAWKEQPARFKRKDISAILGHCHDRHEEMKMKEMHNPSIMVNLRQDGSIDSWNSHIQELKELSEQCSLLIDAYQSFRELDFLQRRKLDNLAWSTRQEGLVLYLRTGERLRTLGLPFRPTIRSVGKFQEQSG